MANELVKEWLNQADEDFLFAQTNLDEQDKFFAKICFHFQQAAEKYLKAYIVAFKLPFKKIHDLTKLLSLCQKKDKSFVNIIEEAKFLTDFYVDTRYPAFWPVGFDRKEAEKAKAATEKIRDFVKEELKLV